MVDEGEKSGVVEVTKRVGGMMESEVEEKTMRMVVICSASKYDVHSNINFNSFTDFF